LSWNYEYWKKGRVIAKRDEGGRFIEGHRHLPDETKKKISRSLTGSKLSEARKQRISLANKKAYSESCLRRKQSRIMKKYYNENPKSPITEEQKKQISLTMTGRKYSEKRKLNISKGKLKQFKDKEAHIKLSNAIKLWWKKRKEME